jgi:hypothetical protein
MVQRTVVYIVLVRSARMNKCSDSVTCNWAHPILASLQDVAAQKSTRMLVPQVIDKPKHTQR